MILTKKEIIEYSSTSPPLIEKYIDMDLQVQPNGFDMSLQSIAKLNGQGQIDFSNKERELPELENLNFDSNDWIILRPDSYIITFNEIVNFPENVMALGRPRSSLLRMGGTINTAVWDAGYCGRSQSLLVIFNNEGIKIKKNARIMQLVFMTLATKTDGYNGVYQFENLT